MQNAELLGLRRNYKLRGTVCVLRSFYYMSAKLSHFALAKYIEAVRLYRAVKPHIDGRKPNIDGNPTFFVDMYLRYSIYASHSIYHFVIRYVPLKRNKFLYSEAVGDAFMRPVMF